MAGRGQQIRCQSEADGHSPDEGERLQLDSQVPVISAVLTPKDFHDHGEHRRFFEQHFVVKGTEAAAACLNTVEGLRKIAA